MPIDVERFHPPLTRPGKQVPNVITNALARIGRVR